MPTRFGFYDIHEALGAGGMAEVHLAEWHTPAGAPKRVALKRLYPHVAENPELVAMFIDEARLARYLNHPNIAQVYELAGSKARTSLRSSSSRGRPSSSSRANARRSSATSRFLSCSRS
jgi:eukaryotic-like serine/threonine-protein kinase